MNKIILFLSTFDNWPKATKCTLCGQKRLLSRVQSLSPPQESDVQNVHRKRSIFKNLLYFKN